jgi:hypothetical protein
MRLGHPGVDPHTGNIWPKPGPQRISGAPMRWDARAALAFRSARPAGHHSVPTNLPIPPSDSSPYSSTPTATATVIRCSLPRLDTQVASLVSRLPLPRWWQGFDNWLPLPLWMTSGPSFLTVARLVHA